MSDTAIVMRSIANSNMPEAKKSAIRRFLERNVAVRGVGSLRGHATHTGHAFRAGGEALITGGLAGLAHGYLKHGLDADAAGKVPLDGIAGLGLLLAAGYAGGFTDSAHDLRNMGSTLLGIATFRKSFERVAAYRKSKGLPVGGKMAGETEELNYDGTEIGAEEDEIVAAARRLSRR